MGSIYKHHIYNHESQSLRPIKNHQTSTYYQPPSLTSDPGFPILAIAVLCIMATAFLLVSYYIFLTKCCLNWQQLDPLRRLSTLRPPRNDDPSTAYSPSWQGHGLDDSLIRKIPMFQYGGGGERRSLCECVVCLNEFQELDMLRVLPNCGHGFHLDCIDIWLQTNANCPLCRSSISGAKRYPIDRLVAPSSSPQDPRPFVDTLIGGGDEDYVVIELGGADRTVMQLQPRRQQQQQPERNESMELQLMLSRVRLPRKFEQKPAKQRKFLSSMDDECVDMREKDDRFSVQQPIRRSFSMDSADDRRVYLAVQEIRQQQNQHLRNSEGSSSSRVRRSFFPFGHGRGSRSAVLPFEF